MKESSMGYNDKNRNPRNGKYGWLGGLVKSKKQPGALDQLEQDKIPYNTDTYEGALDAMLSVIVEGTKTFLVALAVQP
jgi:hypothetical protein